MLVFPTLFSKILRLSCNAITVAFSRIACSASLDRLKPIRPKELNQLSTHGVESSAVSISESVFLLSLLKVTDQSPAQLLVHFRSPLALLIISLT